MVVFLRVRWFRALRRVRRSRLRGGRPILHRAAGRCSVPHEFFFCLSFLNVGGLVFLKGVFCVLNHSQAVTKHYKAAENSLDDGYWDDVFREKSYFENTANPAGETLRPKGREVGEFDVLCVNYEDKTAFYKEVKTSYGDLGYADDQLSRAEEHFEDTSWDVIGRKVLER